MACRGSVCTPSTLLDASVLDQHVVPVRERLDDAADALRFGRSGAVGWATTLGGAGCHTPPPSGAGMVAHAAAGVRRSAAAAQAAQEIARVESFMPLRCVAGAPPPWGSDTQIGGDRSLGRE